MAIASGRIRAFDWLRGLAVLFMIQCHALTFLLPPLRETRLFAQLQFLDGLVAPSFIFSAGFSLALVQIRGAAAGTRLSRVRKTARRLLEVLLVATLVNWAWFPIWREPRWIFRIDILQCIGVSLFIALPILAALAPRPRLLAWVSFGLAMLVFCGAPYGEAVRGPWAAVANTSTDSVFPLLPWAGYVYLGASAGAVAAQGSLSTLIRWIAGLGVVGLLLRLLKGVFASFYPPHQYWVSDPANHGERWVVVCLLLICLLAFESRASDRAKRSLPLRFILVFGTSSMAAYFFHEMLLFFQFFGVSLDSHWGKHCGWAGYSALTIVVIGATCVLSWLTDKAYGPVNQAIDGVFRNASRALPKALPDVHV